MTITLRQYCELVLTMLDAADEAGNRAEAIRVMTVLRDVLNDEIQKLETKA